MYNYEKMKIIDWENVCILHKIGKLEGYYKIYPDGTESQIETGYDWSNIQKHYELNGKFGIEILNDPVTINFDFNVKLSKKDIESILIDAIYENSLFDWCDNVDTIGASSEKGIYEYIARGGILKFHNKIDNKDYFLNKDMLIVGIKKFILLDNLDYILQAEKDSFKNCTGNLILKNYHITSINANIIIQYAIFGDKIY